MNERGFFTIIGLWVLLVVAFSVITVHEVEKNFSYDIETLKFEQDMKNATESELLKAAVTIRNALNAPTAIKSSVVERIVIPSRYSNIVLKSALGELQSVRQVKIVDKSGVTIGELQNADVQVWAEIGDINDYVVIPGSYRDNKVSCKELTPVQDGIVLLCILKCNGHYHSSTAYMIYDSSLKNYEDTVNYVNSTNIVINKNTLVTATR